VKVARNATTRVTVRLIVEFGQTLTQLAQDVRDSITTVVSPLTGDAAPVVDVEIVDVRLPSPVAPAAIPATTEETTEASTAGDQEQPWRS
jgi:uncharacterized alkaline shock family protein YloU